MLSFASACERVDKDNLDGAGSLNTLEAIRDVLAGGRGVIIDVEGRDTAVDAGGRGLVGDGGLDFADEAVVGRANEENDWDLRRCAKVLPGVVGGAPPLELSIVLATEDSGVRAGSLPLPLSGAPRPFVFSF